MAEPFDFGGVLIDPVDYAINGNAILGIKEAGKTYAATKMAELLHDAGIPWIAFDPIGVWRFLRVPGPGPKGEPGGGRGFPVVVAGGLAGDLPLTPDNAAAIVRAAMENRVSLVLDLFEMGMSKADMRRVVTRVLEVLLHENRPRGLRHLFFEEAQEFVPQIVRDGLLYSATEKLTRMGGNVGLGYTLISLRAEGLNKEVLEICDTLFLLRQKGKNTVASLSKWLNQTGVDNRDEVIASLATLPKGEAWAWLGETARPVHIKVPAKQSLHPDRRARLEHAAPAGAKPIDVGAFVAALQASLAAATPAKAGDGPVPAKPAGGAKDPRDAEIMRLLTETGQLRDALARAEAARGSALAAVENARVAGQAQGAMSAQANAVHQVRELLARMEAQLETADAQADAARPSPPSVSAALVNKAAPDPEKKPDKPKTEVRERRPRATASDVLWALAWFKARGVHHPTRNQVGLLMGQRPTSGTFRSLLSEVAHRGWTTRPAEGQLELTDEGLRWAPEAAEGSAIDSARRVLPAGEQRIFDSLLQAETDMTRWELAAAVGQRAGDPDFGAQLARMEQLQIVVPNGGRVALAPWIREAA